MNTLSLLDRIGQIVGGTCPDSNQPRWFSGAQAGDGTGLPGLTGCWSVPPESVQDVPIAILEMGPLRVVPMSQSLVQGQEEQTRSLTLWVLDSRIDAATQTANLAPYIDIVLDAFRQHMQLDDGSEPLSWPDGAVLDCFPMQADPGRVEWAAQPYWGVRFTLQCRLILSPTYSA